MHIFDNPNVNFLKWRWHALALSVLVIGAGLVTIVSRGGLPLGVDFSGGTVLLLKFEQPVTEDAVRAALPFAGDAVVQTSGPRGLQRDHGAAAHHGGRRRRHEPREAGDSGRGRAARREPRQLHDPQQGHRRPRHRRGPEAEGPLGDDFVAWRHPSVHLVPVPAHVRDRRDRRDAARRPGDDRRS